jgi:hypothetical protein
MSRFPEPSDENDWSPTTSRPGEMFTVEGRIRATGVLAWGLKHRDPRGRAYRRSMYRVGLWCLASMAVVVVVAALVSALG